MKFIRLTLFDMKRGFKEEWLKFILSFVVCIACCFLMSYQLTLYQRTNNIDSNISITVMDFVVYNLRGMKLYSPNLDGQYLLPAVWMFNQIMIALIVGNYPVNDLNGYGINTLIRTKSRGKWLLSKIIWVICMVILYYIILYLATFMYVVLTNNSLSLVPSEYITKLFYDIDLCDIHIEYFIAFIILMPILTSIVVSVVQTMMSFIIRPFLSFILIIFIMLSSTYISNPLLIGNASMIIRSRFATPVGFSVEESASYLVIYFFLSLIIGFLYFNKKDIVNRK